MNAIAKLWKMPRVLAGSVLAVSLVGVAAAPNPPPIISRSPNGKLSYAKDERGNKIPDFSVCGYAAGARSIPDAPIRVVVAPIAGDETERIQRALDYVAGLPLDTNGLRGVVLLLRGTHEVNGGLLITNSGVVLRGAGVGATVLRATGLDRRTLIRIKGNDNRQVRGQSEISDNIVPVGATQFHIANGAALKPGDGVLVQRPSTQAWIAKVGAAEFGGGEGGGWKPGTRDIVWDANVKSIEGNLVTIDVPITTALEKEFGGATVAKYDWPGRITNVGVENLGLESVSDPKNLKDESHSWFGITLENAADAWVRQVTFTCFAGSAVAVYESCKRVTVEDCLSLKPVSEIGGYRRHTFFTMGQQTLFMRCYAEHGRHDFSVGHCAAGPNAFVQCEAQEALADSGPIESWASGVLYDNVVIDGNALTLAFRPGNNAGIGWSAANCVLWNCSAAVIRCWTPPGAQNWSFGSWAGFEGDGTWRSSNDFMTPESLFAAQLADRLGDEVAARLEMMPRPHEESSNPPLDKAQELAAAAHEPPPLLLDYIRAAPTRDPISTEAETAKSVEEIIRSSRGNEALASNRKSEIVNHNLTITNGWLTCDGKLLIGGSATVSWWRGNIRPAEAPSFGLGVTRFVPGRSGRGFTDDLNEVADTMIANGDAALDHNYGLWYDRRRDDHERIRRMDGDVLPPFYEQPFDRSGKGVSWMGLSKYDLTKFNPWYWSRLREFAEVCKRRGLLLFHENYFQHNIIEAGAHWVDSPWRTANNINGTGFPEPPPFAGDKRIFQAELFYDVTNSVRRKLHENFIRQCLNNFTNEPNVIQFTSAEFTGPLSFVQFWLDTINDWKREHPEQNPVIALSCTKDVQDAILADSSRRELVDVIDFRYWWRTDKGEFAPPGGKNLAPRQFERQWRGGRPNDLNLAAMAAEYRAKSPTKPLICDFDSAGWAWVCAGGSLPRLPKSTDAGLLAAIPNMMPWTERTEPNRWVLRDGDQQYLIYLSADAAFELDLGGQGKYLLREINRSTGRPTAPRTEELTNGKLSFQKAGTGPRLLWLTKE